MKKLFVILSLIFLALPAFAEYIPIPANRQAEYKAEIEKIIISDYSHAKKNIDKISKKSSHIYNIFLKHPTNQTLRNKCIIELQQLEYTIDVPIFDLFVKLINTTKKYVNISKDVPSTGYYVELWKFMQPYFNDCNIDTKNIDSLSELATMQGKIIEKYCIDILKLNH